MIRLRITPEPAPQERAAIEAALARLLLTARTAGGPRLRYGDAADAGALRARIEGRAFSWGDVARAEALGLDEG